jgi:hypothetical protein
MNHHFTMYQDMQPQEEVFLQLDYEDPELIYYQSNNGGYVTLVQEQPIYDSTQQWMNTQSSHEYQTHWGMNMSDNHHPMYYHANVIPEQPPQPRQVQNISSPVSSPHSPLSPNSSRKKDNSKTNWMWSEFIEFNKPAKSKLVPVKNVYKKATTPYDSMVTKMTYL